MATWSEWTARHDAAIRSRLLRGDEDSLVNLLLFGVSFTSAPRTDIREILKLLAENKGDQLMQRPSFRRRRNDLVIALSAPGPNERLQFANQVVKRQGIDPATAAGRIATSAYLDDQAQRVFREYADSFQSTQSQSAYDARGLSSDTSIYSSYALDRALKEIIASKHVAARDIRRVAIVGPGLDFADKREGHDFYPQQTLQPFAIVESLARLAADHQVQVTTLDLNPRVNQHIENAKRNAEAGNSYQIVLIWERQLPWTNELREYWQEFGSVIGRDSAVTVPALAANISARAIRARPAIARLITPRNLNIVIDRLELAEAERFDLIVATNVLTYYDPFEQSLALTNIAAMLRRGGILLSNDPLVVLPSVPFERVGSSAVQSWICRTVATK